MSKENVAASILRRGVELDNKKRYTEALICYQEGLQILVDSIKVETGEKRVYLRTKIEEYMSRAEKLKNIIARLKDEGAFHEQIAIENNSTGHSYETVFKRFLDSDVENIKVDDPYIRSFHQCQNFLRFCELGIKYCQNLKRIMLTTTNDANMNQVEWLSDLKTNLANYNISLVVEFSQTLHDRQIILSNGWIIKIGRGLDYFKALQSKFTPGMFDYDLRPCHETTVDIFHEKNMKLSNG